MMSDDKTTTLVVLICCSTVVSIIGLILGAVSLSQQGPAQYNIYTQSSGSSSDSSSGNDKVWMIAIGHYDINLEYLDPVSYQIKGYNVDVIDAVCDIANKDCELVNDIYENCWDSVVGQRQRGGPGLMGGWYDACTGWVQNYERLLTYSFTTAFQQPLKLAIYVKNETMSSGSFNYQDLTGLKVGFLDGWYADEHCLARYASDVTAPITGAEIPVSNIIHYHTVGDSIQGVLNGDVNAVFATAHPSMDNMLSRATPATFPNKCIVAGGSMMTQKSNKEFARWWDDAFKRLVGTKRYDDICQNLKIEHVGVSGSDPADICIGY